MTDNKPVVVAQPSLPRAIFNGALLVALDAFVFGEAGISVMVGMWLLLIGLPRTFLAKKYATVRTQRLRNAAIYFVAVILVFLLHGANNIIAQSRAETLVSAVKAFHAKNQRYPVSLEVLVPDYIERVPLAKYTILFNRFWYLTSDQGASLFYFDMPPFGRPTYSFERNEWGYLD